MVGNTSNFKSLVEQVEKNQILRQRITQSIQWYKECIEKHSKKATKEKVLGNKAKPLKGKKAPKASEEEIMADETTFRPGQIYSFSYDPKYAKSLKYYDVFPISLILGFTSGGFVGLNFHYLSPMDRAAFLDVLYQYVDLNEENQQLQINITESILASKTNLGYYKPCFKKYLYGHVRSEPMLVRPHEWDITLFLPTEQFVKASKEEVWKDSRGKIK